MSKQLKLKIITPEKLIFEEMVDQVSIPTTLGEITVLPDHIPLITDITSGDIVAFEKGEQIPMTVVGGFLEVKKDENDITNVAVLADFAEHISELNDEVIEKAKTRAEELKKEMENKEHVDYEHFATELERSLTRIKIADKWRTKKYRK
ncbi:MAG: ATP synthase F1 subunit epsilon [Burkholderiales bacterium]|nr:ATP synthase F1 subunit epsilon [Burkholderiales bacterium]